MTGTRCGRYNSEDRCERKDDAILDEKDLQRLEELVSRQISIVVENQIKPQLRLLAEGTADIQERLIPRARVDELEDEVRFLKLMVRQMAERVSLLEKAQ